MKPHTSFKHLVMLGLFTIVVLSSFYKSSSTDDAFYYDQQSAQQKGSRGKMKLQTAFENPYYTNLYRQGHFYAEVKADRNYRNAEYKAPLNISIVIDRSGSMAGDKMKNAKLAAKQIVDQLSVNDYISIVMYDGSVDVLQTAVQARNKQFIKNKIDGIMHRGGTNLMGGAMEGYAQVRQHYGNEYINRVLLLSDGLANEGITDPYQIDRIVREKNSMDGISISTFGIGRDYNEDLMTSMAESGSGNYYFIDKPTAIAGILQNELQGLNGVTAKRAELHITIPENVQIQKVYGQRYHQNGREMTIYLNDIFSEETKGVLVKYTVTYGSKRDVNFKTQLTFLNPNDGRKEYLTLQNNCEFTVNNYAYESNFSEWVGTQVALYESNENLETAMREVDKGNYEEAKKIVKKNEEYIRSKPAVIQNAPAMKDAVKANDVYENELSVIESKSVEDVKYIQKESKSSNYKIRNKK